MRVGLVVYGGLDGTSGGFRYDRRVVDYLRDAGDDVSVVDVPWRSYPRHLTDNLSGSLRARLTTGFDVLVQDELCHPSLWVTNRRVDPGCPVVSVVHHLRSSEPRGRLPTAAYRWVERRYLETVDAAVCTSPATRREVADLVDLPTTVAPPAADHFSPTVTDAEIRSRAAEGLLRVVFLGNVVGRKGLLTLLRGLARLPRGEWHLTAVGDLSADPTYAARVRSRIDALDLAESVDLTGRLPDPAVEDALAGSHVLAMPSTYEGFGMAYLEGMGFGLPAVATTAGGASAVVSDGETGFLVPPRDPAAVAAALRSLHEDRDMLAEMGVAARHRYRDHPTWAETGERVRAFLRDAVDSSS